MELPPATHESFSSVMRAKGQAAQTALTLLARSNDTQLKRQALGKLPELLRIIQDEESKMKTISHH
jgi:hypothetical protein